VSRPALISALPATEFQAWYWLKEELVTFCWATKLPHAGNKADIEAVIIAHLERRNALPERAPRRVTVKMPTAFKSGDVIGAGWTCNPALGAFFRTQLGKGFHFNKAMRDFIHHGEGQTLAEAMDCFKESMKPGQPKRKIAPSLEYNQHMRAFFEANAGATREDAIAAWWDKRGKRK
jgi:SAP domain-containing new25